MTYRLKLDIFEGPLDLLLYLIKKNDLDISDIPIAEVTEQYMNYIEMMKMLNLDIVGDFLVMAATLMQIKSRMLLPLDPEAKEEQEEDPRDELMKRLYEYKKFKDVAGVLTDMEKKQQDLFRRNIDEEKINQIKKESEEIYFEASLFDLINALSDAIKNAPEDIIHQIVKEEYSVDQKIHEILHCLLNRPSIELKELFNQSGSKEEMIVIFLAVLELIRLKEIKVIQKSVFSNIEVLRNADNIIPSEGK